jgi:hypothetical protein
MKPRLKPGLFSAGKRLDDTQQQNAFVAILPLGNSRLSL